MKNCFTLEHSNNIPIKIVLSKDYDSWVAEQTKSIQGLLDRHRFVGNPNTYIVIPDTNYGIDYALIVIEDLTELSYFGQLAMSLPKGNYFIEDLAPENYQKAALLWAMGAYQFTSYKQSEEYPAKLVLDDKLLKVTEIDNIVKGIYLTRDLINTPCEDMSPEDLSSVAKKLAKTHQGKFDEIIGDKLLKNNFPAIHAVGRGSHKAPRLIEINWGDDNNPHLILVGKGVCFDSGGYDLKSAAGMRMMKKDMGGAANVLGLASLIMASQLPIRLTVLIPAVENLIDGNAYKPGDVINTRKGLTVEIGNTDAEGRVILADALTYATAKKPQIIMDFATLTGAARVAVGTDISALFSNKQDLAQALIDEGNKVSDPIWQLPLYKPYRTLLNSSIADISNNATTPYAGAIIAGLFLQEFIDETPWVHFDIMAWNMSAVPAHPEGGEAMAIQAVYSWVKHQFTK